MRVRCGRGISERTARTETNECGKDDRGIGDENPATLASARPKTAATAETVRTMIVP